MTRSVQRTMKVCAILAVVMLGACTVKNEPPADPPIAHPDDPDWAVLRAHFDHPDGTLTAGVVASVLRPAPANASDALPSSEECAAIQLGAKQGTCPCRVAGTWDFDSVQDAAAKTNTVHSTYHACDGGAGVVDGSEIVRGEADAAFVVLAYSITANGTTDRVDAIGRTTGNGDGNDVLFASKVDDGWVTLSRASGVVRDRAGTWTCTTSSAEYSCVSAEGRPSVTAPR